MRRFLHTLQPSSGGKENLVGSGRTAQDAAVADGKTTAKPDQMSAAETAAVAVAVDSCVGEIASIPKAIPSLYKKLIIEDITSTAGPSEKYWEVIAERRRKALKEVIEENHRLHGVVVALEEENMSCKKLIEESTDLVNTLKELINENNLCSDGDEKQDDSDHSTPDSSPSYKHVNKKIKISNSSSNSSSLSSDSEC